MVPHRRSQVYKGFPYVASTFFWYNLLVARFSGQKADLTPACHTFSGLTHVRLDMTITHEHLKEILEYKPDTGHFIWKKPGSNRARIGGVAGWADGVGYKRIRLAKKDYKVHRLAWFYMTGQWPENQIDHIDGNGFNNSWQNLREATNKQNQENLPLKKTNTSGYRGVYFEKKSKKWIVQIRHNRQSFYWCGFETIEEAAKVAAEKRAELFTHYTGREKMRTCVSSDLL